RMVRSETSSLRARSRAVMRRFTCNCIRMESSLWARMDRFYHTNMTCGVRNRSVDLPYADETAAEKQNCVSCRSYSWRRPGNCRGVGRGRGDSLLLGTEHEGQSRHTGTSGDDRGD